MQTLVCRSLKATSQLPQAKLKSTPLHSTMIAWYCEVFKCVSWLQPDWQASMPHNVLLAHQPVQNTGRKCNQLTARTTVTEMVTKPTCTPSRYQVTVAGGMASTWQTSVAVSPLLTRTIRSGTVIWGGSAFRKTTKLQFCSMTHVMWQGERQLYALFQFIQLLLACVPIHRIESSRISFEFQSVESRNKTASIKIGRSWKKRFRMQFSNRHYMYFIKLPHFALLLTAYKLLSFVLCE